MFVTFLVVTLPNFQGHSRAKLFKFEGVGVTHSCVKVVS